MAHGNVVQYAFEAVKVRLAKRTFYTPDFLVLTVNEDDSLNVEMHEVKGFWQDDARVKIKVAAETFPHFRWVAVTKKKGQWIFEEF